MKATHILTKYLININFNELILSLDSEEYFITTYEYGVTNNVPMYKQFD